MLRIQTRSYWRGSGTRPMIDPLDHLPLVKSIARRLSHYLPPTLDREDLIQEGTLALMKCFAKHDPTQGSFSTYAYPSVRGAMLDVIRRQRGPDQLKTFSMNVPNRSGTIAGELVENKDETFIQFICRDEIMHKLRNLPSKDRQFLWEYHGEARTFTEIGQRMGVSRQRAQKHYKRIIRALRG